MPRSQNILVKLGLANTGLTDLRAQLLDGAGTNVGGAISTGFAELFDGDYLWHYAAFPDDDSVAAVKFYSAATPTLRRVCEINEADFITPQQIRDSAALDLGVGVVPGATSLDAKIGAGGGGDWTSTEREQIRYRLGLNGTSTEPTPPITSPIVITPPAGPGKTTGYIVVLDENGDPKAGVEIRVRFKAGPGAAGFSYLKGAILEADSAETTGLAEFPTLVRLAKYEIQRPDGDWVEFTAQDADTTPMPQVYGSAGDV